MNDEAPGLEPVLEQETGNEVVPYRGEPPPLPAPAPTTPAQAKVDAIAALTMSAYGKAGTLQLTDEEKKALQADFPDDAFQPGAGGKERLIYIEHAALRQRLNQVLGIGQWALVPRNRWAQDYTTQGNKRASTVYVEAMLIVRGCFVAEAVGDMNYFPDNPSTNYGDAVEGAKTAALRRCCKEFGVGLQAWHKDFGDGWWARRKGKTTPQPTQTYQAPPAGRTAPAQATPAKKHATAATREWMIKELKAGPGGPSRQLVTNFFATDLRGKPLEELPFEFVPTSHGELRTLAAEIAKWEAANARVPEGETWRVFKVPWGKHMGTPLEELEKNVLFGFWANMKVETEWQGNPRSEAQIATDQAFRDALDEAGEHYEFRLSGESHGSD